MPMPAISAVTQLAEDYEVVAMNDLTFVGSTELGGQRPGGTAHQPGDLGRVVVDQAAGHHAAGLVA